MSAQHETGDYQEDYWTWQMGPQWAPGGMQPDLILSLPLSIPSSQSPRRSSGSGLAPRDYTRAVSRERGFGVGCKQLLLLATTLNCQCSAGLAAPSILPKPPCLAVSFHRNSTVTPRARVEEQRAQGRDNDYAQPPQKSLLAYPGEDTGNVRSLPMGKDECGAL